MANSVDPDQTAPSGAVWSGSALFAHAILMGTLVYEILGHLPYLGYISKYESMVDFQMTMGQFFISLSVEVWLHILSLYETMTEIPSWSSSGEWKSKKVVYGNKEHTKEGNSETLFY